LPAENLAQVGEIDKEKIREFNWLNMVDVIAIESFVEHPSR